MFSIRFIVSAAALPLVVGFLPVTASFAADGLTRIPVTPDFVEGEINWNDGIGVSYVYRVHIIDSGGRLAICGVGAHVQGVHRRQSLEILKRARVTMNGKPILTGFEYFPEVGSKAQLASAQAVCKQTLTPSPRQQVEFGIDYGRRGVRF